MWTEGGGPEAARELLRGAVAIPSVSGQEAAVAAYLQGWMAARGFQAQIDGAGNAVGVRGHGPLTVVLLGHMDTVPGDIPVREEGGVLYGRGAVDAKGPLCAFMAAVAALPDTALAAARFVVIGATEEEAPSSRGAHHAARTWQPDAVLIGEPSGWEGLTLGYKGRLVLRAQAECHNFHTAGEGQSAGDDLTEAWFRVRAWAAQAGEPGAVFGGVQATVQDLQAGTDGLTQRASGTFGLRLPPAVSPEAAEAAIRAALADLNTVSLTFVGHEHAVRHPRDNALTRALRVGIRAQGGTPVFKVKTGTSDMNVVAPHWPVPTLAYGPGDSALDHTPNEHLDLAEYDRAVAVLRAALEHLAAGAAPKAG
ncbi:[LysW]-lysine hydrolase [Deinococcus arcticus]|uniref:[LysW]-lysine hydrolase n=1 Tax=Deinococcus arcticus TaxID=2136176 RepID=A0A2T3W8T7_9DEIO|nr:[LysW]-lysine hydrolase [Deinococcus arcticus]PTA68306.1 acetyl-lysine deacetylase [Deinococcus arcticus]